MPDIVRFKNGLETNLPTAIENGTLLVTKDLLNIYFDCDGQRLLLGVGRRNADRSISFYSSDWGLTLTSNSASVSSMCIDSLTNLHYNVIRTTSSIVPERNALYNLGMEEYQWESIFTHNTTHYSSEVTNSILSIQSLQTENTTNMYSTKIHFDTMSNMLNTADQQLSTLVWDSYSHPTFGSTLYCSNYATARSLGNLSYPWDNVVTRRIWGGSNGLTLVPSYSGQSQGLYLKYDSSILSSSLNDAAFHLVPLSKNNTKEGGIALGTSSNPFQSVHTINLYTNHYEVTSDRAAKTDIVYLNENSKITTADIVNFVKTIQPATYLYKENLDSPQLGLIAQDVEDDKIFEYIGSKNNVLDDEGNIITHRSLKPMPLTVTALIVCQQLLEENEKLKSRLEQLEAKIL